MDTVDLTFKDFLEKFEDFGKCEWLTVYSNNREDEKESSGFYSALISRARIKKSLEDPSWDLHIGDGFPGYTLYFSNNLILVQLIIMVLFFAFNQINAIFEIIYFLLVFLWQIIFISRYLK